MNMFVLIVRTWSIFERERGRFRDRFVVKNGKWNESRSSVALFRLLSRKGEEKEEEKKQIYILPSIHPSGKIREIRYWRKLESVRDWQLNIRSIDKWGKRSENTRYEIRFATDNAINSRAPPCIRNSATITGYFSPGIAPRISARWTRVARIRVVLFKRSVGIAAEKRRREKKARKREREREKVGNGKGSWQSGRNGRCLQLVESRASCA